jgi:hypothetical protein
MAISAQALTAELNRRCHCVGTDLRLLHGWLDEDLKRRGLTAPIVSTHPHLFSELPVFVTSDDVMQMRAVIDAIESVLALPAYQAAVLARAPAIANLPQGAGGVFLGYDFHLTDVGPKLIEINTNAGGAMLNVAMMRAQQACCMEVADYLRSQPSPDVLEDRFVAMFQNEWQASVTGAAGRPLKCVAIVDEQPEQQYLYPEFLLFTQLFESQGIRAVIAAPEHLQHRDGGLWLDDQRIDLVYNRLTDFYWQAGQYAALRDAYTEGAVIVTPHPRTHAVYANKHNLSVLTDERELLALGVRAEIRATLLQGIPRTVAVSTQQQAQWWTDRKQWFFKPASGFGSRGSYRGDKLTKSVFAEIMQSDYIAQRCVPPSERWIDEDGERPLKFDVRNYVYNGEVQLLAARLYQGQTTNFRTAGGGFAPVYVAA